MIFTLTDRHYNPLDSYETDDYLIGRYIGSILETLDLNISLTSLKAELWVRGNYIMCRDSTGRGYWFTIYDDEDSLNGDDRALSCYSGTIDIVAEECPPFEETVPRSFGWYFSKVFIDTGIQLGINELSGMTRTLKFESKDATNAEMLQFVLNAFDNAEARLDVAFDGSRPTRLTLNVFKRLGETVPKVLLSDESDSLTDLDRTGSISELGTSLLCYGAQDDNQKEISLVGKYYEEKDANGNILYVSPKDSPRIFSVKAHEEYYVQLPGKKTGEFDGYINRSYQSESSTQDSLWNEGLAQLKKIDHAIVDYKATGYVEGCDIGDNVQIAAHRMRPAVMVSARLTTFKFNEDDPERNEYEFTNFVDLESNLDDMSDIINKIKDQIVYVIDQSVEYCLADQGTTAPETGWSNVNQGAVKGKWLWTRTKIDYSNGTSSVSEVATYSGVNGDDGRGIAGTPETTYAKSTNGTTPPTTGWTTTLPSVPAGQYLWAKTITKYTDDTESTTLIPTLMGPKGDPGAAGVGLKDKAVEYAKGTSGTVPPASGWSTTIPTVGASEYLWTRTTLTYTDDSSTVAYSIGKIGANGSDAQLLYLTATAENMVFNADDTPKTEQTITISAKLQNVTGTATFKAIPYIGNTAQSAITLGGSGNNRTLSSSQWTNKDWTLIAITATLGSLSDTLSVVKVKDGSPGADGRTPYLHTAYKMADGTFIDTYPGENHVLKSKEGFRATGNGNSNQYPSGINNIPLNSGIFGKETTIQAKITISNYKSGSYLRLKLYSAVGTWGSFGELNSIAGNGEYLLRWKGTLPQLTGTSDVDFNTDLGADILIEELQFKEGLEYQLYTPSPFEDYVNAYPLWKGTYTDYLEEDSPNPDDYVWERILGESGAEGVGIANAKTDYQLHTSATTPPTGTWLTTPPAVTVGKYLWTRTILVFTDGTESTPTYSVSGGPGADGEKGDDALPVFSGYVTNEAIILFATNSGTVSDFSKATGTFVTYLGQDQLTSGVTYSQVSQSGVTASIDAKTGAYSVTAASADTGMVVFKAVYQGIEIQKIVSVTKAKQGPGGKQGEPGPQGDGSYLHVVWKMADGTFTNVYPGENLFSTKDWQNRPSFSVSGVPAIKISLEPNTEYIMSTNIPNWADNTTCDLFVFHSLGAPSSTVNGVALNKPRKVTTLADGIVIVAMRNREFSSGTFWAKLEKGTTPTIYTPAPADDYSLAYPKYRGEYTDTIEADSTDPNRYTWTAYLGEQGPPTGVISQNTVPSSPYVGMLWQNTGNITGYINPATYRWNGSAWEIYQFTAQNILAETFTGFVFQGVKFIGSEFISNYSITKDGKTVEGTLSIGNGNVLNDYSDSDGVVGKFTIDESGAIINQRTLPSGIGEKYELTPYSLALDGETYRGNVTARQLSQLNAVGDRLWDGAWHMSASQTITPDRPLSSCLTGWLLEFQGYSSNTAQDTDYSYIAVPKSHSVYHSGKPMSPAVTVYGGAITRKILYITDTTIKGHANNAASPASGAVLTAVYAN